jgi:hypothetical protein
MLGIACKELMSLRSGVVDSLFAKITRITSEKGNIHKKLKNLYIDGVV